MDDSYYELHADDEESLRLEEYQTLAMRTSPEGHDRILNGCLGLIGETGEVVDLIKKWKFQSGDHADFPVEKMIEECGDVLWYCAELSTGIGASLYQIVMFTEKFFKADLHEENLYTPIEIIAGRLAAISTLPFIDCYDPKPDATDKETMSSIAAHIVGIYVMIKDITETFCDADITDVMQRNIDKLRKRYPDGFDPERSLHRTE